ncbi:MAG: hypothetical protein ABFD83_04850 [Armatimonadota bacterium]
MSQFIEVVFLEIPRVGERCHILLNGQEAITSPIINIQTNPQYPGWFLASTQSGSQYTGQVNIQNNQKTCSTPATPTVQMNTKSGQCQVSPLKRNVCSGIIAGTVILLIWLFLSTSTGSESKNNEENAFIMSQVFVERNLKSPSTAKFPTYEEDSDSDGVIVHHDGPGTYIVISEVNSENSFGAMIRNYYLCRLTYKENKDTWELDDLRFSDTSPESLLSGDADSYQ